MIGLDNPIHLAFLLVLLLLVFGAKRLPEMGRSLGSGMRGFKDALSSEQTPHDIHSMTAMPHIIQSHETQQEPATGSAHVEEQSRTAA
jgi:sec-independent protein translocase protein TatA